MKYHSGMSYISNSTVCIRGNYKSEEVAVGGERYVLLHGEIIRYMVEETDDLFWNNIYDIAISLEEACIKEEQTLLDPNIEEDYIINIYGLIDIAKRIMGLTAPDILKKIIYFLPIQVSSLGDENSTNQLSEYFYGGKGYSIGDKINKQKNTADEMNLRSIHWSCWEEGLLEDGGTLIGLATSGWFINGRVLLEVVKEYSSNLKNICFEGRKIAHILSIMTGLEENKEFRLKDIESMFFDLVIEGKILLPTMSLKMFGSKATSDSVGIIAEALSSLINFELHQCERYSMVFERCQFCGGIYASRKMNEKYCSFPNARYGGKPCKEVAVQIKYNDSLKKDWTKEASRKNYLKYKQWVRRVKTKDISKKQRDLLYIEEILYREDPKNAAKAIEKILDDIEILFEKWKNEVQNAIKEYKEGKISEEVCRAMLVVPEVKDRSSFLYLRKDPGALTAKYILEHDNTEEY